MYHVGTSGWGFDCLVEQYALFEFYYSWGGVSCGGRLSPGGDACWFWFVWQVVCLGWGFSMTKRADLKEARDDRAALEGAYGLVSDDFLVKNYLPSRTIGELSDEQMDEAVEMARLGAFEKAIARVLGVNEGVFMSALKKGKDAKTGHGGTSLKRIEFAERFYAARKEHMKKSLRIISEAADEGDWKPAAWQLERSFGFVKNETVEVEAGPQIMSLMQLAQIPMEQAQATLQVEGEVVVESDDAA